MKNSNKIIFSIVTAIIIASIVTLIVNNNTMSNRENSYSEDYPPTTSNANNVNNSFVAPVVIIMVAALIYSIYYVMMRTNNSDIMKNVSPSSAITAQVETIASESSNIKNRYKQIESNKQSVSELEAKYKKIVDRNMELQLKITALQKQKADILTGDEKRQLQTLKSSAQNRQSELQLKIRKLQQQLNNKKERQEQAQKQKLQNAKQMLKQRQQSGTNSLKQVIQMEKLRKKIKELQLALSKSSDFTKDVQNQRKIKQQFQKKQRNLRKEIESLRADIKSINPIKGSKETGEQLLDKLKQWEKLKRASEKRSERYNKHIQTRKAIDFLGQIEKKMNTGFIEAKFGRQDIVKKLQELYIDEMSPYEEKEKLYKNYLTNFYLYSILTNYLNNGNFTESAANKQNLVTSQTIDDYVKSKITGLDSIPSENDIQERFGYILESNNIARLDKSSEDLPRKIMTYIKSGTTINLNNNKQVSNPNEVLASFVNNNNIKCDGIFVKPEAKLSLLVELCSLRKKYPKIYDGINIKTFLKDSFINICLSLYGNSSIPDKEKDIRSRILEIERQMIRNKLGDDVSKDKDIDDELFNSLKSKLMLMEYELVSDKAKRPVNYKQVIQKGREQEIQKELVDPFEKGFIGFAMQAKARVNRPVKPANDQQILKLYKDNLVYKKIIQRQKLQTINNIEQLKQLESHMKGLEFVKQYIEPYIDPTKLEIPNISITSDYKSTYNIQNNSSSNKNQVLADHYEKIFNNVQQHKNAILDLLRIKSVQPIIIQNVNLGIDQKITNNAQRKKLKLTSRDVEKMLSQTISKNQVFEQSEKGISSKPLSKKEFLTNYINNIADERGIDKSISIINLLTNVAINKTRALARDGAPSDDQLLKKGQQIAQKIIKREKQNIARMNQTQSTSTNSQDGSIQIKNHPQLGSLATLYKNLPSPINESAVLRKLTVTPVKGYKNDQVLQMIKTNAKFRKLQNGSYELVTPQGSKTRQIQNKQSGGGKQTNQGKSGGGGNAGLLAGIKKGKTLKPVDNQVKSGGGGNAGFLAGIKKGKTLRPVDNQVKSEGGLLGDISKGITLRSRKTQNQSEGGLLGDISKGITLKPVSVK